MNLQETVIISFLSLTKLGLGPMRRLAPDLKSRATRRLSHASRTPCQPCSVFYPSQWSLLLALPATGCLALISSLTGIGIPSPPLPFHPVSRLTGLALASLTLHLTTDASRSRTTVSSCRGSGADTAPPQPILPPDGGS